MKKRIGIGLCIGMAMCLGACSQPGKIEVKTEKSSTQNENWEVNVEQSVFSSSDKRLEQSCHYLNAAVQERIDSLRLNLITEADTFFALYRSDTLERPIFNYELYVRDTVFLANADYISLRMSAYIFTGGAHGMTYFYAFNYDVKKQEFLKPNQLLDLSRSKEIDALLKKNFKNEQGCYTEIPTLANGYTAFNFSTDFVYFTYPAYVLGPYSCGPALVAIPRAQLKEIWR